MALVARVAVDGGWLWPVSCGPEAAGLCSACDRGVLLWIAVDREAEKGQKFRGRYFCLLRTVNMPDFEVSNRGQFACE